MKKSIIIVILFFATNLICYSQLPSNYPFKAVIDNHGDIYVTGDSLNPVNNTLDFVVKKLHGSNQVWATIINNLYGDDKGMDIVTDNRISNGSVYATGYLKTGRGSFQLYTVKLSAANGNILWTKNFPSRQDCQGFSIALDNAFNSYVTGYYTANSKKNIIK